MTTDPMTDTNPEVKEVVEHKIRDTLRRVAVRKMQAVLETVEREQRSERRVLRVIAVCFVILIGGIVLHAAITAPRGWEPAGIRAALAAAGLGFAPATWFFVWRTPLPRLWKVVFCATVPVIAVAATVAAAAAVLIATATSAYYWYRFLRRV
ncbi:MAG: hypothetical protein HYU77_16820 [Betaproteobacteria bacterium]|nr:hypothetical protein [Betaproteobacteria bacterium]